MFLVIGYSLLVDISCINFNALFRDICKFFYDAAEQDFISFLMITQNTDNR